LKATPTKDGEKPEITDKKKSKSRNYSLKVSFYEFYVGLRDSTVMAEIIGSETNSRNKGPNLVVGIAAIPQLPLFRGL
jgi:hypothetical protein